MRSKTGGEAEGPAAGPWSAAPAACDTHGRAMITRASTTEERLRKALGEGLLVQEPLRLHTTFRIGGPADFYYAARDPETLVTALRTAREIGLPVFLLGGGSNLLVSDEGFRGLVLRN